MTPTGEDVRRALLGWPRCPSCGEWMEAAVPIMDGEPEWRCVRSKLNRDYHIRWVESSGWQRFKIPNGPRWSPFFSEEDAPVLHPAQALSMSQTATTES